MGNKRIVITGGAGFIGSHSCKGCGVKLSTDNWMTSDKNHGRKRCADCHRKYFREYSNSYYHSHITQKRKYNTENYDKNKAHIRKMKSLNTQNIKLKVIKHYSPDIKCQRCGFSDVRALSIDHINGRGAEHRRKFVHNANFYYWIINHGFPSFLQVLCMNCQWIKRRENKEYNHKD